MKRRLFPSHSPSNLGSATLETHADCRRADCSVNPGNVHDSLHFFDEKEKKDKKKKHLLPLFYSILLLDFYMLPVCFQLR